MTIYVIHYVDSGWGEAMAISTSDPTLKAFGKNTWEAVGRLIVKALENNPKGYITIGPVIDIEMKP